MRFNIIAIAPYDGWAYVKQGKQVFLLRPPYRDSDYVPVSLSEVDRAIEAHGFHRCDHPFKRIPDVVAFLKQTLVESLQARGFDPPTREELRKLLKRVPERTLRAYLARAKEEVEFSGDVDGAISLILDMLELDQVRQNPDLHREAVETLRQGKEQQERLQRLAPELDDAAIRHVFGDAAATYGASAIIALQKTISARHNVWSMV